MTNLTQKDFDPLLKSLGRVEAQVKQIKAAMLKASEAAQSLAKTLNSPAVRRLIREQELGYQIPDWVWGVEETMRRTEGSGNGRIMRD